MLSTTIFDLDGTLIDSKYDIIDCLSRAYYDCMGVELPLAALKIGPPLEEMLHAVSPELSMSKMSEIILSFRTYYKNSSFSKTKYFDGIIPLLSKLHEKKCLLFIATNKPLLITKQIIQLLGKNYFGDNIITIDTFIGKKLTKSQMLNEIIIKNNLSKKNCIFIGDSPSDVGAAKQVALTSVAVGYGYYEREELIQSFPDFYIETVTELSDLLITN
jgi:phosphoglycolate phosphatase